MLLHVPLSWDLKNIDIPNTWSKYNLFNGLILPPSPQWLFKFCTFILNHIGKGEAVLHLIGVLWHFCVISACTNDFLLFVRPERTAVSAVLSADPSSFGSTIHEQLKWRVETIVTWYGAHCSIFILFSRMRALLILFYTSMPKFWVHKLFLLFFCWNFSFWIQEFQKKFC